MPWPGTIDQNKAEVASRKPLHLYTFTFGDGTILRVSSLAVTYGGNAYLERVKESNLGALQQLSQDGLDVVPNVSVTLANADQAMFLYEQNYGFQGARVDIAFVLYDVMTGTFSTDSYKQFSGRCGMPEVTESTLTVQATFLLQLGSRKLPTFPIQQRCPKIQPKTAAELTLASQSDSIYYPCGLTTYSVDCNYTREGCNGLGHLLFFGGVTYNTPDAGVTREYVSGQRIDLRSNPNAAKYGDYVPIVLGTSWVDCVVTNTAPEGNSTRGEAIIAEGMTWIYKVTCNDELLPAATDVTGATAYSVQNPLFRYNVLNDGSRSGRLNQDDFYKGNGDPYGSMAAIEWCVPRKVESGGGIPRVRALVKGKAVRVYSDANTFTDAHSDNPAWNILYILHRAGLAYGDVDLASFVSAAAYYGTWINYTDENGATRTHPRYATSMVIRQRVSATDVVSGLLRSCNSTLLWSPSSGKVQLLPKASLAQQQPSAQPGANSGTAISSYLANGASQTGYAAFRFTPSTITKNDAGEMNLRRLPRSLAEAPNAVGFPFTNSEREFVSDSITMVDSDSINAAGQQIDANLRVDGISTLDQAKRIARTALDELSAPTWEFESSFNALKVSTGQLVALDVAKYELNNQLCRVLKVQPSSNSERIQFTVSQHDDSWYFNANGQSADAKRRNPRRNRLARPAYAWAPAKAAPAIGDPLYEPTDATFSVAPKFDDLGDGTRKQKLEITGKLPVNSPAGAAHPPIIALQGTQGDPGSGSLVGGGTVYYFCVTALDSDNKESAPSDVCTVAVSGGGAYSAVIPVTAWGTGTVKYRVYGSTSTNNMTLQSYGDGTPASITIAAYSENDYACPDTEFFGLIARPKWVVHGGVAGAAVTAVGAGTITVPGCGLSATDWAGRDVMIVAKKDGSPLEVLDYHVVSNTTDVLTVTPDPAGHVAPGDVIVFLTKCTFSGKRLTDLLWKNPLSNSGNGLAVGAEKGNLWRVMAGKGRGESYRIADNGDNWVDLDDAPMTTPDATSRGIVEAPWWLPTNADLWGINNSDPAAEASLSIPLDQYKDILLRIEVASYDGGDNESPSHSNPERLVWLMSDFASIIQPVGAISTNVTLV